MEKHKSIRVDGESKSHARNLCMRSIVEYIMSDVRHVRSQYAPNGRAERPTKRERVFRHMNLWILMAHEINANNSFRSCNSNVNGSTQMSHIIWYRWNLNFHTWSLLATTKCQPSKPYTFGMRCESAAFKSCGTELIESTQNVFILLELTRWLPYSNGIICRAFIEWNKTFQCNSHIAFLHPLFRNVKLSRVQQLTQKNGIGMNTASQTNSAEAFAWQIPWKRVWVWRVRMIRYANVCLCVWVSRIVWAK